MSETFLNTILASTRSSVASSRNEIGIETIKRRAEAVRSRADEHRLGAALSRSDKINIIAEIKRASPSKGVINGDVDVRSTARNYERAGAAAISILTENHYFKGSIDDLKIARESVDIPLLRKDFTVDEYQIYEAAASGADAVLLIVAALTAEQITSFLTLAESELGMDAIVEVHSQNELETAIECGANIIGVNNRNLHSFGVSLDISRRLIRSKPPGALMVAESGISTADEINELRGLGFNAFLVGETLMRSADPSGILKTWM